MEKWLVGTAWMLIFLVRVSLGQYVQKIWEYRPAPGQFINQEAWGTPQRANFLIGGLNGGISLGSLGGYIVLGFQKPIENDPNNPYGMDFTIFGNASSISAEPASVWVMHDDNQNGFPDDTWYRLAGSHDYFPTTQHALSITYFNPFSEKASNIPWEDSNGKKGMLLANQYHQQPYYPLPQFFPDYPQEKVSFQTSKLSSNIRKKGENYVELLPFGFGYADNRPRQPSSSVMIPDNPYTLDVLEGSGGDAMDIDWAVDAQGNYVRLEKIHFVKIQAACLENVGWLGEISPEITGIVDLEPNASLKGETRCLVWNNIPMEMYPKKEFFCQAILFDKGRPINAPVHWEVLPTTTASITENGVLHIADNPNSEEITLTASSENLKRTMKISIIVPHRIEGNIPSLWQIDQRKPLSVRLLDKKGNPLSQLSIAWKSSAPTIIDVLEENGTWYAHPFVKGFATLTAYVKEFPEVQTSYPVEITETLLPIRCLVSALTPQQTLFPLEPFSVQSLDLSPWIDKPSKNYTAFRHYTLAHAIASFAAYYHDTYEVFKEHPTKKSLYISKIKQTIGTTTFEYNGFGGQTEHGRHKAWGVIYQNNLYLDSLEYIQLKENQSITLIYLPDIRQYQRWAFWQTQKTSGYPNETFVVELLEGIWNKKNYVQHQLAQTTFFVNQQPFVTNESGFAFLTFSEDNTYTLTYQNAKLVLRVGTVTSTEDDPMATITVYPNPCRDFFFIDGNIRPNTQLVLYDVTGNLLFNTSIDSPHRFSTYFLQKGIYLLKIYQQEQKKSIKLHVSK